MAVKLFVGNLSQDIESYVLKNLFSQYGLVVECTVKGSYGFVHMRDNAQAMAALNDLNGHFINGSPITVELSKSKDGTRDKNGQTQKKKLLDRKGTTKIFIGNIKDGTSNDELRTIFEPYGEVTEADVCGGYGFVHMRNKSEANSAIKSLRGYLLNGNKLNIELSTRTTQGRSKPAVEEDQEWEEPMNDNDRFGPWGRGSRGRGMGQNMRFEPYGRAPCFAAGMNGPRRPPMHPFARGGMGPPGPQGPPPGMFPRQPPMRPFMTGGFPNMQAPTQLNNEGNSLGKENFAKELLDLYLKNPVVFDRYARDPLVQQSLSLDSPSNQNNQNQTEGVNDPFYRPPREYYEKKLLPTSASEAYENLQPVTYPNIGMGGRGMRAALGYPPMRPQFPQHMMGPQGGPRARMPFQGSNSVRNLYTSFE